MELENIEGTENAGKEKRKEKKAAEVQFALSLHLVVTGRLQVLLITNE